jgi:hypothetical protein
MKYIKRIVLLESPSDAGNKSFFIIAVLNLPQIKR